MRFVMALARIVLVQASLIGCAALLGRPSMGGVVTPNADQKLALARIGQKVQALVVWSSSRVGNHDLFLSKADGSELKALTRSDQVDWFPRFSPDGKTILFTRSKKGFVFERDANRNKKWDLYTIDLEGKELTQVAQNASWGTWIGPNEILFARKTKVFRKNLLSKEETLVVDSQAVACLGGADLQQPQLSPDQKYLAITLRGSMRETGVFNLGNKTWTATGQGCQITWHPKGDRIYWINPSGNGGSEVFSIPLEAGKPKQEFEYEQMRFIDIPGRRSHEYFPQMSDDATWMVWAATQRGHDHDVADYEIYIWEVGRDANEATRLTFHSGNDRWPDIHILGQ